MIDASPNGLWHADVNVASVKTCTDADRVGSGPSPAAPSLACAPPIVRLAAPFRAPQRPWNKHRLRQPPACLIQSMTETQGAVTVAMAVQQKAGTSDGINSPAPAGRVQAEGCRSADAPALPLPLAVSLPVSAASPITTPVGPPLALPLAAILPAAPASLPAALPSTSLIPALLAPSTLVRFLAVAATFARSSVCLRRSSSPIIERHCGYSVYLPAFSLVLRLFVRYRLCAVSGRDPCRCRCIRCCIRLRILVRPVVTVAMPRLPVCTIHLVARPLQCVPAVFILVPVTLPLPRA